MKLITKAIEAHLHRNYRRMREAEAKGVDFDPLVPLKLFMPETALSFYIVDCDPRDPDRLFGFVTGMDSTELGYFSLAELESLRSPQLHLGIERDAWWTNIKLSELRNDIRDNAKEAEFSRKQHEMNITDDPIRNPDPWDPEEDLGG